MPRLSFVLAVHGEQAYLDECAESILGQGFEDVELVVVDDASPDHAPDLLDALAGRDPRVRVTHLTERIGPGRARNLGLDAAEGEHVWFVQTTDRVAPGAAARVAARLEATDPDVLLVGFERAALLEEPRPGPQRELLAALDGTVTLAERPELGRTARREFDKVLRRAFLAEHGIRFGPRGHSELTVTWPALLEAQRIAALPETAYVRRRPPNAARFPGTRADLDAQYAAVLARAGDRADLVVRPEPEQRSSRRPSPRAAAARLRRRLERRPPMQRHYRRRRRQPVDPQLAAFAAYWYGAYACNPRAVYERARELVPGLRGVWVVKPEAAAALPPGVEHVAPGTREYYDLIARAGYLVNNVNWPNHLVKREGSVHVMTHHGTPLKRMGLDERASAGAGKVKDFSALVRRCRRWDYSVSQNAFTTLVWERVYPFGYESLEVGYPRNDVLATATDDDVARARERLGIAPGLTTVLYAPTYREYDDDAVPVADVLRLAESLPEDHVVLMRLHSFTGGRELAARGRILDVAAHPVVEEVMLAADALVTDYSSIMFDYAVLDRPIVIHAPDWETYRAMRGTTFDVMAEAPGAVTRDAAELADAFASGRAWESGARRAAFRERFCSLEDGRAAERVVRRVWLGERITARDRVPILAR